jgi:hypothetical protein
LVAFVQLNLSEDDTEESANNSFNASQNRLRGGDSLTTPVGSRRDKGPLRSIHIYIYIDNARVVTARLLLTIDHLFAAMVARPTGNLSEDGKPVQPSEDDAEQAIDSGSGDIEGGLVERRRARKQRKRGTAVSLM